MKRRTFLGFVPAVAMAPLVAKLPVAAAAEAEAAAGLAGLSTVIHLNSRELFSAAAVRELIAKLNEGMTNGDRIVLADDDPQP